MLRHQKLVRAERRFRLARASAGECDERRLRRRRIGRWRGLAAGPTHRAQKISANGEFSRNLAPCSGPEQQPMSFGRSDERGRGDDLQAAFDVIRTGGWIEKN